MSIDEGYIKYESDWTEGPPLDERVTELMGRWRRRLFEADLIGHDERHGVGYGNLSIRLGGGQFAISGTQTGHVEHTTGAHYALVTDYDIDSNRVSSTGPIRASSEAMTHAMLYRLDERINAVVHVHSGDLWSRYLDEWPTTAADVGYGTPAMAHEFERLYRDTDLGHVGFAVMAGHREGIVSIGRTLAGAASRLLDCGGS